ncbi:unnamed protein product [Oppiella nova]|uniref:Inhibitor of growth protein n=1 Tax=Oppiella nova TaxID=334625 RepID=A0A7R9MRJ8_9ACAR|nr:unnamed protein product [Oppiella nova]CAG2181084.1 unnamed protein product [Oppiella nova]
MSAKLWMSSGSSLMSSSMAESPIHSIAQYIEDYMDLVDNVPNDIARQMTQLHEHNHRYHQLLELLKSQLDLLSNPSTNELRKRNALLKVQRSLIEIQEIADEKLLLIQSILDQLDSKARQLDFDYRSVTLFNSSSNQTNNSRVQLQSTSSLVTSGYSSTQRTESTTSGGTVANTTAAVQNTCQESTAKEVPNGNSNGLSNDNSNSSGKRASARRNTTSRSNHDNNGDNPSKRAVKRGMKSSHKEMKRSKNSITNSNSSNNSLLMGVNSPPNLYEGAPIDPDEPTYCLCEQVSFGEMICCDNTDCKIEWFHFSCVSLNTKPKGKWFCPHCRGDRSNIQKK